MSDKKKSRITLEDEEQPTITMETLPKEEEKTSGRPKGAKDKDRRLFTAKRMEALKKAQAVRKQNIEKRRLEKEQKTTPPPVNEPINEVIKEPVKPKPEPEEAEEVVYKKLPRTKPKKKIIYYESSESEEVEYIKKPRRREREKTYDEPPAPPVQKELSPLELLIKHYGQY